NRLLLKNISVVGVHWGYYQRRGSPLVQEWTDALMKLYGEGRLRPVIYRAYPLREAAAALEALASRASYGKVVLVP
ncbi:MAG TPA: zinc-binding dehydrogenase, partial [Methylomirabilota bacterium]|nr:zinc-binding dehydrogenase [Methylomirabilota bacterium]